MNRFKQPSIRRLLKKQRRQTKRRLRTIVRTLIALLTKGSKYKILVYQFALPVIWLLQYLNTKKQAIKHIAQWKWHSEKHITSKIEYNNMITLVDKTTEQPIDESDTIQDIVAPTFEAKSPQYHPLNTNTLAEADLAPSADHLRSYSFKVIAVLFGSINRLGKHFFSKLDTMFQTDLNFPENLPQAISHAKNKSVPRKTNVLHFLGLKWAVVLQITYIFAITAELTIFQMIGVTTLKLDLWKSWLFAGVITGISYVLTLIFFQEVRKFLRAQAHTPSIIKLFLSLVIAYILSTGFLGFMAHELQQTEAKYLTELQHLNQLQIQHFSDPNNVQLQADIQHQQSTIATLDKTLNNPSLPKRIVSAILYILMSCISLTTSALLLAVTLCVSKVNYLKRQMNSAKKRLLTIEIQYQGLIPILKKAQELMDQYIFLKARLEAINTMLATAPQASELVTPPETPNHPPRGNQSRKRAPKAAPSKEKNEDTAATESILSQAAYDELYNEDKS